MANKYLQAAIKYATQYGWAVFPIDTQTKKPLTPHGCKDAKKGVGPITAWWKKWPNAGIGVATGSASNIIVIDEDVSYVEAVLGLYGLEEGIVVNTYSDVHKGFDTPLDSVSAILQTQSLGDSIEVILKYGDHILRCGMGHRAGGGRMFDGLRS